MSMHYLIRNHNSSYYPRLARLARDAGVDEKLVEAFESSWYIIHDGPEEHTRCSEEALEQMLESARQRGFDTRYW